jgi:hypothetical protein
MISMAVASVASSAMKSAVSVERAVRVGPAITATESVAAAVESATPATEHVVAAAESAIATAEPAIAAAESVVAPAESCAALKIAVPTEAGGAISAPEACVTAKIPAVPEVAAIISAECLTALASEVSPSVTASLAVAPEVAPPVAAAVVPPTIVVVKIDPRGIAKSKIPAPVERRAIESAKPGARADENTVREPLRPVVAIRRARVGGIWIIAILADRRRPCVHRRIHSNSDSHTDLCASRASHHSRHRDNKPNHRGVL